VGCTTSTCDPYPNVVAARGLKRTDEENDEEDFEFCKRRIDAVSDEKMGETRGEESLLESS
jgi:hypothetical protein